MIFRFASPEYLWLLVLLPVIAVLLGRKGKVATIRFSDVSLAAEVSSFVKRKSGRFLIIFRLLSLAFVILALARPQSGSEEAEIKASGIDIVLAVDLSGSMWGHDFEIDDRRVDRLTVVKKVMKDFIHKRPSDRIGMVAFAGVPYLVSPLTLNHSWLLKNLERLEIGLIEDGTAIGTGIGMCVNRLRDQPSKSRIVILLTDGSNNSGKVTPKTAAEAAESFGIKIYTVGAGIEGRVPYPSVDENRDYIRNYRGELVVQWIESDIDEETLTAIAELTNAKYYRAKDTEELEKIYEEIDELEKTDVELKYNAMYSEIFHWFLLAGFTALLLEQLLGNTIYRKLP